MLFFTQSAFAAFPGGNGLIAFSSERDGGAGEIYVMNPGGSGATRLTFNNQDDSEPAWSPDGSKIVFVQDTNEQQVYLEIYTINADGSNPKQLTSNLMPDDTPDWQPIFAPVGGVTSPINKFELLAPYIILGGLIIALSAVIIKKKK